MTTAVPSAAGPGPVAGSPVPGSPATEAATAQGKAAALIEALPWLARFHGQIVVIKLGGHAMEAESLSAAFAQDVVFLHYAGLRPVLVHGGGPQVSARLDQLGLPSTFRAGLRVTTPEAMTVVRMVLTGQVNRDLVGLINRHGPFAVGISGEDAHLLTASRAAVTVAGQPVDLGQVGQIESVNPGAVAALLADGRIPVISSVARGAAGEIYNVNADTAAAALAVALGAAKLVLLTDVPGLYADWPGDGAEAGDSAEAGDYGDAGSPGTSGGGPSGTGSGRSGNGAAGRAPAGRVISQLTASELAAMLPGLSEGMIPKMEACLTAVSGGVPQAHVLDGRQPHAVLLEVFTDTGVGTMVVPDQAAATESAADQAGASKAAVRLDPVRPDPVRPDPKRVVHGCDSDAAVTASLSHPCCVGRARS